ncbi:MAG TPA: 4Fe-4S dicluster domain-containing protein [Candidatus Eisenbergiella merdavium]|uniref:4Fe-4S dicluster domain-containing protein n=1 Tax=Candidatus Eisenbergiella merdavium TaxID=2838551 RepID=A0A9D2NEP5_9FIRM|nr:4Fe-4S dicluster domain-containing protein [Candidatus Eisenbergiella merdavium]
MEIKELAGIIRENGIAGAGGAGFPTYMKIDERAQTILLNCAECEPLLKLHRQLLSRHTRQILQALSVVKETVGAEEAVIGIKGEYEETVRALKACLPDFPGMRIQLLDSAYPMGDEVVLIYEATGKVVRPGGLPIEQGIAVFNVETMYNISRALQESAPVTEKLVSVVGEVASPVTLRVPLGASLSDCVEAAGGALIPDPVYLVGGPMMGSIRPSDSPVTKTTNAVIVLSGDHPLIQKKRQNPAIGLKRAASACCQCETCTDLCPRHALGHPIEPHKFMRAAANRDFRDANPFLNTFFCSSCGLCELYSCPQGLAPRSLMAEYKTGLRKAGVKAPADVVPAPVRESRQYRKAPEERLEARLGLSRYDADAPLTEELLAVGTVKLLLSQHIGAPAVSVVQEGDRVEKGQLIGKAADGLSIPVHASVSGTVRKVEPGAVVIAADRR